MRALAGWATLLRCASLCAGTAPCLRQGCVHWPLAASCAWAHLALTGWLRLPLFPCLQVRARLGAAARAVALDKAAERLWSYATQAPLQVRGGGNWLPAIRRSGTGRAVRGRPTESPLP